MLLRPQAFRRSKRDEHAGLIFFGRSLHGATLDPKRFRSVMGAFATGVAVIATEWSGELFGATVNSLTSFAAAMHASVLHERRQRDGSGHSAT